MHNVRTKSKNQIGHQAGTGERTQSVLLGRVGSGLVGSFLSASAGAGQRVLRSIWHWLYFGSTSWAHDTVVDCDGRSIQRAGHAAGSGRRRLHCGGAQVQGRGSACGHRRRGAAAMHYGLAQSRSCDRGREVSIESSSETLGQCNRREPLSASGQQRPEHQRQCVQSRCNGAAGPALWLQALIALLSRHCMPGGHEAGQTRRCIGLASRAGSARPQVHSHNRKVLSQTTVGAALLTAARAWLILPASPSRTQSVDASRGSVRRRAVILNRLTIDSDPP